MRSGRRPTLGTGHRALFDRNPDAILDTRSDGRITAANPAACDLFGMSEIEL